MSDWGPFSLAGKNSIITGGATGIGLGIAESLAEAGANTLIADLDGAGAAASATRIREAYGVRAEAIELDVTSPDAGEALCAACSQRFGGVNIVCNNAGVYPQVPMLKMSPDLFDKIYRLNLRALAFISKAAGNKMVEQGTGGRIINIASIDAFRPTMIGLAAYGATKGGVVMFTKNLALEMASVGVTVNAIAPGGISTRGSAATMLESGMSAEQMNAWTTAFTARVPLGRIGTPRDVGTAAVFLASAPADYITGTILLVDGGYLLT